MKISTQRIRFFATAFAFVFAITGSVLAQQPSKNNPDPTVIQHPTEEIQLRAVVNFSEIQDDWDPFLKTVQKIHTPGVNIQKDEFRRLKAEANQKMREIEGIEDNQAGLRTSATGTPIQGSNFFGNTYSNADPADNAMAVSKTGVVVSAHNTRIHIYDENGTLLSSKSLFSFASSAGISTFVFDPKVTFDPDNDRFVVVFLAGASASSSKVVVAFSQTSDPTGSWNFYTIPGNVGGNGVWTDFPQIALSSSELFITGNLFLDAGGGNGAVIWQIDKADGYAGTSLSVTTHEAPSYFSLHPVEGGLTLSGPRMFFLESDFGTSNQIHLHEITNTAANSGVLNVPVSFTMNTSYSLPPDATQKGSANLLQTNDTRVQSSYIENNRIQFTLNTSASGVSGVFFGTGEISPFLLSFSVFSGEIVSIPGYHMAYGSVAYGGQQHSSGINHTFLGFNYCGPNYFPGTACVYIDENGMSSDLVVKGGSSYVTSADNRWGDYADFAERHNNPGEAWIVGTMGNGSHQQRTYISQIYAPWNVAEEENIVAPEAELTIYPNPTTDRVVFEFPVAELGNYHLVVRDVQGKLIKDVVENTLQPGIARVAFDTGHLSNGTYILSVENESQKLFTEKFTVQH